MYSFGANLIKCLSGLRCWLIDRSLVSNDSPVGLGLAREMQCGLQIRLIEAWEDKMAVISGKLRVDVLATINLVDK